MFSRGQDLAQNSIQIKQDERFYSRLLSKESSIANPSFGFYHGEGAAAAIPFMWESQPGTPKCSFKETTLPPLTPPPSYYSHPNKNPMKKNSRSNRLLNILFPKMNRLKKSDHHVSSLPSSSSLSSNSLCSSSNLSMFSTTSPKKCHHRVWSRFSSTRSSSFDSRADYDEEAEAIGSETSTLWSNKIKACYGW